MAESASVTVLVFTLVGFPTIQTVPTGGAASPCWLTLTLLLPATTVVLRAVVDDDTSNVTVAGPLPLLLRRVSQRALLVSVHGHVVPADTVMVPLPPVVVKAVVVLRMVT